jgi:hypothetical protein
MPGPLFSGRFAMIFLGGAFALEAKKLLCGQSHLSKPQIEYGARQWLGHGGSSRPGPGHAAAPTATEHDGNSEYDENISNFSSPTIPKTKSTKRKPNSSAILQSPLPLLPRLAHFVASPLPTGARGSSMPLEGIPGEEPRPLKMCKGVSVGNLGANLTALLLQRCTSTPPDASVIFQVIPISG